MLSLTEAARKQEADGLRRIEERAPSSPRKLANSKESVPVGQIRASAANCFIRNTILGSENCALPGVVCGVAERTTFDELSRASYLTMYYY